MAATQTKPKAGLVFGCSCPGCGAELEFSDSLWVTTCTHCNSVLRIVMPSGVAAWMARATKPLTEIKFLIDRYCREQGLTPPGHDLMLKQFYYPYWRADASLLKVRTRSETRVCANEADPGADVEETQNIRAVSLTPYSSAFAAGPTSDDIPETLGLRAEYLRLFPFAAPYRDDEFDVVPITKTVDMIANRIRNGLKGLDNMEIAQPGGNTTRFLRPAFSLVYFPYIIAENYSVDSYRLTVDGVTGKVLSHSRNSVVNTTTGDEPEIVLDAQPVFVEAHRCATCGRDFAVSRSLIYRCDNCSEWTMLGSCARVIHKVEWQAGAEDDHYLPFWGLQIPDTDRAAIGTLLGYHRPIEWLVVPAFDMPNTEAAYRLALRATGCNLLSSLTPIDREITLHAVTLEFADASTLSDIILIRAAVERQLPPKITRLEPTAVRLFAMPFHPETYFWVDSLQGVVTVERAAISD